MSKSMENHDFDRALIAAVFDQAALRGWPDVSIAEAARTAGLPLARARARFPGRGAVLLRFDPATSLLLYGATLQSMKWLLDGAGIPSNGIVGTLRVQGLLALWLYALRAWEGDESPDLSATMAAVDRGLDRAIQAENILPGRYVSPAEAAAEVFEAGGMVEDPIAEADAGAAAETNLLPSLPPDIDPPASPPA